MNISEYIKEHDKVEMELKRIAKIRNDVFGLYYLGNLESFSFYHGLESFDSNNSFVRCLFVYTDSYDSELDQQTEFSFPVSLMFSSSEDVRKYFELEFESEQRKNEIDHWHSVLLGLDEYMLKRIKESDCDFGMYSERHEFILKCLSENKE